MSEQTTQEPENHEPQPARTVVVAEDEALIRLDIVEILKDQGFTVVAETDNGQKAVELAEEHQPDLVLMDVNMPIMDGIEAAGLINEKQLAPVVLLTAFSQKELVDRATEAGAMAYVVKPFTPNDLIPAIEVAISRYEQIRALQDEVANIKEQFETRKLVDRAKSLLMTKMGLSEPEAFRWIQKTSMDRRLSMREVAETIVKQVQ
ncbi:ANTAR domain-containing response regulator [Rothia nasimurium]|uniref:ANTAR domain-containing response regulator n=1 Tax=Rothia nasimurium TaxID=85336 RepID=UPI001F02C924|nr:response regulator [Rothia nasimurium]